MFYLGWVDQMLKMPKLIIIEKNIEFVDLLNSYLANEYLEIVHFYCPKELLNSGIEIKDNDFIITCYYFGSLNIFDFIPTNNILWKLNFILFSTYTDFLSDEEQTMFKEVFRKKDLIKVVSFINSSLVN